MTQKRNIHILIIIILYIICIPLNAENHNTDIVSNLGAGQNIYVSNCDSILTSETEAKLNVMLDSLYIRTNAKAYVVFISTLGDGEILSFAKQLFGEWNMTSDKNKELLVLYVGDQQSITIKLNEATKTLLTDNASKQIQEKYILPLFDEGRYDDGILAGMEQVIKTVEESSKRNLAKYDLEGDIKNSVHSIYILGGVYIIIGILFGIMLQRMAKKINQTGESRTIRQKKMKSKSVYLFVALLVPYILIEVFFAIVGSISMLVVNMIAFPVFAYLLSVYSSIVISIFKNKLASCECGGRRKRLSYPESTPYLSDAQQYERQIGSVQFDVLLCQNCQKHIMYAEDNKESEYSRCPDCNTRAYESIDSRTIISPTLTEDGVDEETFVCKHCNYKEYVDVSSPAWSKIAIGAIGDMARTAASRTREKRDNTEK